MEQTEEKLRLEKQMIDLRRDVKTWVFNLEEAKREYNSVVAVKDKVEAQIKEQKDYLVQVLGEISDAKVKWAVEKDAEWQKIDGKLSEAENVLKRKKELNEQEQTLRDIQQKTEETYNKNLTLEDKLKMDKVAIDTVKEQIATDKKKFEGVQKAHESKNEFFKQNIKRICDEYLKL